MSRWHIGCNMRPWEWLPPGATGSCGRHRQIYDWPSTRRLGPNLLRRIAMIFAVASCSVGGRQRSAVCELRQSLASQYLSVYQMRRQSQAYNSVARKPQVRTDLCKTNLGCTGRKLELNDLFTHWRTEQPRPIIIPAVGHALINPARLY